MLASPPNRGRTQISPPRKRFPFPCVEVTDTKIMWTFFRDQILCLHLTGGDDISNDVITLDTCLHSHSFPLHTDWRNSDSSVDREPQGNWNRNSNSRHVVASYPSFSCPATRAPRRACWQASPTDFLSGSIRLTIK